MHHCYVNFYPRKSFFFNERRHKLCTSLRRFIFFFHKVTIFCSKRYKLKSYTYSSTIKNLSPSDATHLPRKLSVEPFIKTGCWFPLKNHDPSHLCGKVQFVAGNRKGKIKSEKKWLRNFLYKLYLGGRERVCCRCNFIQEVQNFNFKKKF